MGQVDASLEPSAKPTWPDRPAIDAIQYFRAIAALIVVLFHTGLSHSHFGGSGVDLFFIISGFIMALVARPQTSPLAFATARVCRIYPIYWLVTVAAILLAGGSLADPAASLLLWPGWPIISQAWTLQIEIYFYAIVAVGLWLAPARMVDVVSAILLALVAAGLVIGVAPANPDDHLALVAVAYTHPIMLEFVMGFWLHRLWSRGLLPSPRQAVLIAIVALAYFALTIQSSSPGAAARLLRWGVPHALLLWAALGIEAHGRLPRIPILRFLGDASYSLYLVHQLVLGSLKPVLWHLPAAEVVLIELVASQVAGVVLFVVAERPLVRAAKQLSSAVAIGLRGGAGLV